MTMDRAQLQAARAYALLHPEDRGHAAGLAALDPGRPPVRRDVVLDVGAVRARKAGTGAQKLGRVTAAAAPRPRPAPAPAARPMDITGLRAPAPAAPRPVDVTGLRTPAPKNRPPLDLTGLRPARDLSAARSSDDPPQMPLEATRFVTGNRWRWSHISLAVPDWRTWEHLLAGLTGSSAFDSCQVVSQPIAGPEAGLTSVRAGSGRSWVTITIDPRETEDEQRRIMRHELGHLADVVNEGEDWLRIGEDPARRAASERWAEHCETWLRPSMAATDVITAAWRHVREGARRAR